MNVSRLLMNTLAQKRTDPSRNRLASYSRLPVIPPELSRDRCRLRSYLTVGKCTETGETNNPSKAKEVSDIF